MPRGNRERSANTRLPSFACFPSEECRRNILNFLVIPHKDTFLFRFLKPQAETVLKEVKEKYVDNNFSFSVRVIPFRRRVSNFFHKSYAPKTQIIKVIEKNGQNVQDVYKEIGVSEEIWKKVLKGKYLPEKSFICSLSNTAFTQNKPISTSAT